MWPAASDLTDPIETARLRLRRIEHGDAAAISRLMTPEVTHWLASWPTPVTEALAAERIAQMQKAEQHGTAVCLAIERRDDGVFLGCVMVFRAPEDPSRGALGYWLGEPFHRRGYMTEAAAAAVAAAFARLDLTAVEAGAQPENAASLTLMRALGMQPIGSRAVWASGRGREELCEYYEITRTDFDAARIRDAALG
jgi:ribosomal-protein-alanine N-acetyltransferase